MQTHQWRLLPRLLCEGNILPFMDYCRSKEKVEIPFYGEMNRGLDI